MLLRMSFGLCGMISDILGVIGVMSREIVPSFYVDPGDYWGRKNLRYGYAKWLLTGNVWCGTISYSEVRAVEASERVA